LSVTGETGETGETRETGETGPVQKPAHLKFTIYSLPIHSSDAMQQSVLPERHEKSNAVTGLCSPDQVLGN